MRSLESWQWQSHKWPLVILVMTGVTFFALISLPIHQPGTMDSHYYYGGGGSLLENRAFVEPYIWNYLDAPPALPAPSHLYWMPLPSVLVAMAQTIFGPSFQASQLPFILLAAGLPLISYGTGWIFSRQRRHALVAGFLTIFSGFFVPYWTIPETFAPFALFGGLALFGLGFWLERQRDGSLIWVGLSIGLAHLSRADGVLLLIVALFWVLVCTWRRPRRTALASLILLAGYLMVMAPWFIRNQQVIGVPLSTAGTKTIWLRDYDEIFSYSTPLTLERYLAWGWQNILRSKIQAGWINLQTFLAVDNLIFLTPLSLVGFWQIRRRPVLWPGLTFALALYAAMTLLFTFPGSRGGFFHSSAALLPSVTAASLVGLDKAVDWAAKRRRAWDQHGAKRFFSLGLVALAAGLSFFIYSQRIIGTGTWSDPIWNHSDAGMGEIGIWLKTRAPESPIVMVGNPPAFTYHTGLLSIVIPNEGTDSLVKAARRYHATYLILDQNHPKPLREYFQEPRDDTVLRLVWRSSTGAPAGFVVYEISSD